MLSWMLSGDSGQVGLGGQSDLGGQIPRLVQDYSKTRKRLPAAIESNPGLPDTASCGLTSARDELTFLIQYSSTCTPFEFITLIE